MKFSMIAVFALAMPQLASSHRNRREGRKLKGGKAIKLKGGGDKEGKKAKGDKQAKGKKCHDQNPGRGSQKQGITLDNAERLLLREGIIDEIPATLCNKGGKNVILVVGDGMGWEMIRAGAIAKRVLTELKEMGVDTTIGATGKDATDAMLAFKDRTLSDYYTEGKGAGLSFQDKLDGYDLMTTSATLTQAPNPGYHYAPAQSLLAGSVKDHDDGMAPLALDECGEPIDFSPLDYEEDGGNMVLWNDVKGGEFPWDERYYQENPDTSTGFDPEYIMRHATDSASTAGSMATGHKAGVNMMAVNLYEEKVSTLVEDAMMCGKAAGVVSSVPMLHATPGSFVSHSNYRKNGPQLQRSFRSVNPTLASATCAGRYQPSEEHKDDMRDGSLSNMWTILEQDDSVSAENFYSSIGDLDPDEDQHLLVCLGGDYTASREYNLPYRGLDSTYTNRWCSEGTVTTIDVDGTDGVTATTSDEKCNHYSPDEVSKIPHIAKNVDEAMKFLGKDPDGFFLMYEQGDIDWAAHANHMDDMLGTMLDVDESVGKIITWIDENGGWEKNVLYVTADHDHYLTLNDDFPERVARMLIMGESHNITPKNNSGVNPWSAGINAGRHEDDSKSVTEHIKDFSTWTEEDIASVGHFWGARGSGGNGWGSHSTRPVPLAHMGDDGCLEKLRGGSYQVLGREVEGIPGKVDQIHLHACMLKHLFMA